MDAQTSEFYMWRAVFAFAMADREITPGEAALLREYRASLRFTPEQAAQMEQDFAYPPDVQDMYRQITLPEHKQRFCAMARALAWCEGDLDKQDERILKRVSCLGTMEERDHLRKSRENPELQSYYDQYTRNGVTGFYRPPHVLEVRA